MDPKPSNIVLSRDRHPLLIDFGNARPIGTVPYEGEVGVTLGYSAPELFDGVKRTTSAAVDVYSLGAVLYFLLTGRSPNRRAKLATFTSDFVHGLQAQPIELDGVPPDVPDQIVHLLVACLQADPDLRPDALTVATQLRILDSMSDAAAGRTFVRPALNFGGDIPGPVTGRLAARLSDTAEMPTGGAVRSRVIPVVAGVMSVAAGALLNEVTPIALAGVALGAGASVSALISLRRDPTRKLDDDSKAWLRAAKDSWESAVNDGAPVSRVAGKTT